MELLANVYSYMGNSYLELGKYELALENHQKDLDIANEKWVRVVILETYFQT